jgi:hypothetical protein
MSVIYDCDEAVSIRCVSRTPIMSPPPNTSSITYSPCTESHQAVYPHADSESDSQPPERLAVNLTTADRASLSPYPARLDRLLRRTLHSQC